MEDVCPHYGHVCCWFFFFLNFISRNDYERRALNETALARYESRRDVLGSITSASDSHRILELGMCICTSLWGFNGIRRISETWTSDCWWASCNFFFKYTRTSQRIEVFKLDSLDQDKQLVGTVRVLAAILRLNSDLLVKPESVPQDCTDERWKWFKVIHISIKKKHAYS